MSRHHRLGIALRSGERVVVPEAPAHHLARVLRARVGERFVVVSEDGGRWEAEVCALAPLAVEILGPVAGPGADPEGRLDIWCPLLKGGRTGDLMRQLTELGATRIVPWVGERSVMRLRGERAEKKLRRWRAIAAEATKQCGRVSVPEIAELSGLPTAGPGVFFWEEAARPAREVMVGSIAGRILIGPEGGLSASEAEALVASGWQAAWLGARVLRAETAAVVAATLALHALGEGGY